MKKIITATALLVCIISCRQDMQVTEAASFSNDHAKASVPVALLNPPGESWKVSPADTSCYISSDKRNNKAGEAAGKLVNAVFEANDHYRFAYQLENEVTVEVQGTVSFKNKFGKNIFVLQPLKGTKTLAGKQTLLTSRELMEHYSTQYLWEKMSFKELPRDNFLLLVDLNAHPMAGAAKTGTIERSWISKFYSR